jgi:hypothetical protein
MISRATLASMQPKAQSARRDMKDTHHEGP